jgi:hypothetical protein
MAFRAWDTQRSGSKGHRVGTANGGQVSLWTKVGGDPKKFLNGVSVYSKQWRGASVADNLQGLCDVAQETGSGVALWELSLKKLTRKRSIPDGTRPSIGNGSPGSRI